MGGQWQPARAKRNRPSLRWPWFLLPVAVVALLLACQPMLGKMAAERVPAPAGASVELPQVPREAVGEAEPASAERVWVVASGDTLWTIARRLAPDQDPRRTVEILRRVNGLRSAALQVGQNLAIPAGLGN